MRSVILLAVLAAALPVRAADVGDTVPMSVPVIPSKQSVTGESPPVRNYRLPAKLPEAQMTTMSRAEMDKWRAKAPASTVYTVVAGSVIDARTEPEEVLSPWALYVSTFADVGAAVERTKGTDLPPNVKPSIKIILNDRTEPVYLNGERFDPADCKWFPEGCEGESHHEFLRWYAYTGACKVEKRKGGGWNFTSLEGAERDAAYRAGGAEPDAPHILANYFKHEIRSLKECRAMWAKETPQDNRRFDVYVPARAQVVKAFRSSDVGDTVPVLRTELDVLRDASVRVWCGDAGGSGTVVFAEPGRSIVVTAAHVIDHPGAVEVRAGGKPLAAKVLLTDREADWAAVEVAKELPCVVAVSDDVKRGDEVLLVGGSSVWTKGKVVESIKLGRPGSTRQVETWLLDYDSTSGDSGGGVFVRGQLVAVHVGRYGDKGEYARAPRHFAAFVARAIRGEKAAALPVAPSSVGDAVPVKQPPAVKTVSGTDCPNGNCPLPKATYAGPVSSCAGGSCAAPVERRGLFRRW